MLLQQLENEVDGRQKHSAITTTATTTTSHCDIGMVKY
jgi:hypothetical protein